MSQNNVFDQLRLRLLEEVNHLDVHRPLPESFTVDFFKLIEMAVFSLMHREDNFFGSCMIQMKRGIKFDLPSAAGVTADASFFNMYFNPLILLRCSLEEIRGVIKHQIYHIMFRHLERVQNLQDRYSPLALNTGMDLAINQFIDCLPQGEITLEEAEEKYGVQLKKDQPFEAYCEILQRAMDRTEDTGEEREDTSEEEDAPQEEPREEQEPAGKEPLEEEDKSESQEGGSGGPQDKADDEPQSEPDCEPQDEFMDDFQGESQNDPGPEEFQEGPGESDEPSLEGKSQEQCRDIDHPREDKSLSLNVETAHREENCHDIWGESNRDENLENVKEMTRKMANEANRGQIPAGLEEVISELNRRPEVKWQDILRKTVGTLPVPYKKTITRKDRRQPDRLDLRGRLSDRLIKVIIALDTSASMGEEEFQRGMAEIFSILRLYRHEVTVIECGDKIEKVYLARSPRDVQRGIKGRGGTAFSPVFEYINQKQLRNHLLIYFTDGYGEEELKVKPVNYRTLWVLTGKGNRLSLKKPYGTVKTLKARG